MLGLTIHIVDMCVRTVLWHVPAHHRKSAVELLEASKGSYVKSRQVLDHRQGLKHPENLSIGHRYKLDCEASVYNYIIPDMILFII